MSVAFPPPPSSRKAQALAFIETFLVAKGRSPTMDEIAGELKVGRTRAKALVHKLAAERSIERAPGSQRGIHVPGLSQRIAIEQLRAAGFVVIDDAGQIEGPGAYPKGHLPIVAVLAHTPDPD